MILFRSFKVITKGPTPREDRNEWMSLVRNNSVVIGFELKSIGNLFTDEKLVGLDIPDTARLRQFYSDKLQKYCEIELGRPCLEVRGCNIQEACPEDKICVNDEDEPNGFRCEENVVDVPTPAIGYGC